MKKILLFAFFATICFTAKAQQFGDWEVVCWDSAGVTIPLQVRVNTNNSGGNLTRTFFRFTPGALVKCVPTVGTISACGNSQLQQIVNIQNNILVNLDSIISALDSVVTNTTEPQSCECTYRIDYENNAVTIGTNQQQPVWSYDQVVTRNCGGTGFVEILRVPSNQLTPKLWHMIDASTLTTGSGVIDSLMFATANPTGTMKVYLSPALVASRYPSLVSSGAVDTTYLRYLGPADTAAMADNLETVINYAITAWGQANGYGTPFRDITVRPSVGNSIYIYSYTINDPTATTVGLYVGSLSKSRIWYHRNSSTPWNGACGNYAGSSKTVPATYSAPCGPASVSWRCIAGSSAENNAWMDSIVIYGTPFTRLSQVDTTCTVPCPEIVDNCIEICNSESNPIPVYLVAQDSANACAVQNIVEIPAAPTGTTSTLPANYYHSVSITVTSGTVTISAVNTSGTTSGSFDSGKTFTATARECELIPTSFIINATSGAATVATIR